MVRPSPVPPAELLAAADTCSEANSEGGSRLAGAHSLSKARRRVQLAGYGWASLKPKPATRLREGAKK